MRNNLMPLPNDLQAERAVLGCCVLSREAFDEVSEILKAEDFYDPNYSAFYKTLLEMDSRGQAIDFVTVSSALKDKNLYDRLGGQPFFAEMLAGISSTVTAGYYAKIVSEKALRRRFIEAGDKISGLAFKLDHGTDELINESENLIFNASQGKEPDLPLSMYEMSDSVFRDIEDAYNAGGRKINGFASGFADLDEIISCFQPGSLNIIAARPSMGKTALALNIAQFGGNLAGSVLIFSLEMSAEQLTQRMYSAQSEVKLTSIITGIMDAYEFSQVQEAAEILKSRKIHIFESSELTARDFHSKCRRFKHKNPDLSLIVVDYLQLMHSGNKYDNRQNEVAEISRVLKSVAIELKCPVIALSQLSRETERRTEKKPRLSDLRDSGAIEQDADTVILLYRGDYYDDDRNYRTHDSKAELTIAKNRTGRTGACNLTFRREYTKFANYSEDY